MTNEIRIVPFRAEYAAAFARLNIEWIEKFFALEPEDRKLLNDPQSSIIDSGGQIFFALDGEVVAGTAAAIRVSDEDFELGKMAVSPSHQGRGIGELLGNAVIGWTRDTGAHKITLETNRVLGSAIRLYERLGFVHKTRPTPSEYARADIYMELELR